MRGKPDPLDPNDPRVLQEWTDKLGQKIHPGDYVVWANIRTLGTGKVTCIKALRADGAPLKNGGPHIEIHCADDVARRRVPRVTKLLYNLPPRIWDPATNRYKPDRNADRIPLCVTMTDPIAQVVKVDWSLDE